MAIWATGRGSIDICMVCDGWWSPFLPTPESKKFEKRGGIILEALESAGERPEILQVAHTSLGRRGETAWRIPPVEATSSLFFTMISSFLDVFVGAIRTEKVHLSM